MANIQTGNQINFVLYTKSLTDFKLVTKDASTLYFILDDRTIYLDGVYYGVNKSELNVLDNRIASNTSSINSLIDNVNTITSIIAAPIEVGDNGSGYTYTTISGALKYLDQTVSVLQTQAGGDSVANQILAAIQKLDTDKVAGGTITDNVLTVDSGNHVAVRIIETDGIISGLTVVESDIASASALSALSQTVSSNKTELESKIEAAKTELIGNSTDASSLVTINAAKNYAKTLVNELSENLSGADQDMLETLNAIKAELEDPTNANGLSSFLDKINAILNGFELNSTESGYTTIKNYIDAINTALTTTINSLDGSSVKTVNSILPSNGNVTLGGANINVTNYSNTNISGNVVQTDTVNNAIAKVENKADTGITNAAAAQSTANTAQENATTALAQLKWTVI